MVGIIGKNKITPSLKQISNFRVKHPNVTTSNPDPKPLVIKSLFSQAKLKNKTTKPPKKQSQWVAVCASEYSILASYTCFSWIFIAFLYLLFGVFILHLFHLMVSKTVLVRSLLQKRFLISVSIG